MKRRQLVIVGAIAVVLALVAGWFWRAKHRHESAQAPAAAADPWATPSTADHDAVLAKLRAARGDQAIDTRAASVSGTVTRGSDHAPVAGAVVTLTKREFGAAFLPTPGEGPAQVAVTDAKGAWTIASVAPGEYVASAAAADLLPANVDVDLAPATQRTGVDLVLGTGGFAVTGVVSDIGGGPIAEARVTVMTDGLEALHAARAYIAVTTADGRYKLTLPAGKWSATASEANYVEDSTDFELRDRPLTVDFTLVPGGTIHGVVLARDTRKPVEGARVTATADHGGKRSSGDIGGMGGVTTDASGAFTIHGVGSGATSVRASGKGFASDEPTVIELGIGEEVDGVEVLVDRAYTISGFVVRKGKQGDGVAGVRVGVFSIGEQTGAFAEQSSAKDGYFEITGVRPAKYLIAALGDKLMPEIGKSIAIVDKDVTDVLIEIDAGATLSGTVSPPAVASLSLSMDMSKVGIGNMFDVAKVALVNGTSDESGAFTLTGVPPGTFSLVAQARDGRQGTLPVTVTADPQHGLVVKLEPRAAIAGTVVDAAGTPVAGVHVRGTSSGASQSFTTGDKPDSSVTAADGSFRIAGLDAGTITLSVSDETGDLAWAKGSDPKIGELEMKAAEERTGVVLKVETRDGVIRGRVVSSDGQAVADAWVTVAMTAEAAHHLDAVAPATPPPPSDEHGVTISVSSSDSGGGKAEVTDNSVSYGEGKTVLTTADGKFVADKLRQGTYRVVAEATKGGVRAQQSGVKTGDTVTLKLEKLGSLTVTVTANGRPSPSYSLTCDAGGGGQSYHRKVASADGSYKLERLPPGTYECTARSDDGTGSASTKLNGTGTLAIALGAWASVAGVVVDAAGKPVAGVRVVAKGGSLGDGLDDAMSDVITGGGLKTDANGHFEATKLAPGTGEIIVFSDEGFAPLATKSITLVAGQRLDAGTITETPPADVGSGSASGSGSGSDDDEHGD